MADRVREADLIARAVGGDGDAFGELVEPYEQKVYGLAYRMCGNRDDAYDLAQEAFLKTYRALDRFKGDSSFSTWLYRVVANTCLDQLRHARRSGPPVSLDDPISTENGGISRDVADTTFEPETMTLRSEVAREIRAAVALLPPDHRLAILLRDFEDLTYDEIAQAMGCGLGTVKSRISRAREALREHLARRELLPGVSVYSLSPAGPRSRAAPAGSKQAEPAAASGQGSGPARGVDA